MRQITQPNNFLGLAVPAMVLAGGSWIMVGFCVFAFLAVAYGYYTQRGSGITTRPYGKIYGGAPGAFGPGEVSGHDSREQADWSRGTR
jgi:hypothetical protein